MKAQYKQNLKETFKLVDLWYKKQETRNKNQNEKSNNIS